MDKIKVLFFTYKMGEGGAARTLLNIMNNLDRDYYTPVLVTLDFDSDYEAYVAPDIVFIKLNQQRLRRAIFPLAKVIRKVKADVVFSTIPVYNTIAILGNCLSFTHAKNIIREADNLGGDRTTNLKLRLFGLIYKLSSQVISLSQGVKDNLVKRYNVKADNIEVIYNPVDLDNIRMNIQTGQIAPEHQHLFTGDEKVIVTAGRLVPQKDHKTLIEAFAMVNHQMRSRLVILGEGPLLNELKQQAETLELTDCISFIGFQDNPYMYFSAADLFALTSIHEGFGHVIAEAMAAGTPVVATDCRSGPREVLADGQYGRLVPVGNAQAIADNMLDIFNLPSSSLEEMVANGYQRVQAFDARYIVRQYETVFSRVHRSST